MSHSLSFAHLVFVSAYLKRYHPAAFCAGLLRAQPMGFYSPQSLIADVRRHGVTIRGVDINTSLTPADAGLFFEKRFGKDCVDDWRGTKPLDCLPVN